MTFDLFTMRSILLPYAFVWEKYSEFQTTPLEPLGQFCTNFIWSLLGLGEWKIAKMVAVNWPRWPPCPYMVKTFKNLLLQNRGRLGAESLLKSSGTGGLPKLLNNGCTSLLPYAFVWEKTFKNLILQNRGCLMAESLHILLGTSACLQWLCHSGERTLFLFLRENKYCE